MRRATNMLGTATVIGLLAVPVAQSYDDWVTPLLWKWVTGTGHPKIIEHEAEISDLQSTQVTLEQENAAQQAQLNSVENSVAGNSRSPSVILKDGAGHFAGVVTAFGVSGPPVEGIGTEVLLKFSGDESLLVLSESGFDSKERFIYFGPDGCGGTPYSQDVTSFDPVGYIDQSGGVWRRSMESGIQSILISYRIDTFALNGCANVGQAGNQNVVPYVYVGNIAEVVGPFSVSLE